MPLKFQYLFISTLFLFSCSMAKRQTASENNEVLFVGDSQTAGALGELVHEHLKNHLPVESFEVYGIGSSSPRHWGKARNSKDGQWLCNRKGRYNASYEIPLKKKLCKGPEDQSIFSYINRFNSNLVVFQFLGNSVGFSESQIKKNINELLSSLGNQDCLFITSPPHYIELEEKNKVRLETEKYFLNAIGSRCRVIRGMSEENLKFFQYQRDYYLNDKIHLSKIGAQVFFEQFKKSLP
ncbi:MAG: hypothetical protein COW00_16560 [Bdellovibrio sp. CG12_big_fil_rev_8_21_14_0_65_39_13]|nr:MAG: hypothetical protein COW78_09850 [Bdellovibrio sp. CG22_combo_CG10-13_8_21_14_all_39_27]PIQ58220.1 MAG: hypothetical protein COW00_16560 [Bdellovibrio sp. CG12_big_fil_rev_8_21_14_0_65_39_13]PIR36629.1 MAG: hypothetical protein COV37_02080 [Bdellovibrio sp. CG11_big_fil_rev_8_21_14_0_20_39_38]PJB52798.1 MAG: hypothetical protein CO099_10705 [Bdellovibrio sp. CG_4_9_14_3_um_filter_39_7]